MTYPTVPPATWPFKLSSSLSADEIRRIEDQLTQLVSNAPYGWSHTLDLGPIQIEGLFGENHLRIAGLLDDWQWWPTSLSGATVADIGCFSGALSLMMSARGASRVFAVDEIPEHLAQCEWLARTLDVNNISALGCSLYDLPQHLGPGSLDLILMECFTTSATCWLGLLQCSTCSRRTEFY